MSAILLASIVINKPAPLSCSESRAVQIRREHRCESHPSLITAFSNCRTGPLSGFSCLSFLILVAFFSFSCVRARTVDCRQAGFYRGLLGDSPLQHVPISSELISARSRCIVQYQSAVICLHTDVRIIIWYSSGAYPPVGNMAVPRYNCKSNPTLTRNLT